ncbi:MAG: cytochrome c biogenesis CcdA family protein [Candidatus Puniceispirillales bacterium]
MLDVSIGAAVIAGVLSFFSPCVLPIVPGYLGYLSGLSDRQNADQLAAAVKRFQLVMASVFFVAGFVSVFMLIGLSSSYLGSLLARNMTWLQQLAGVAIIILGVHFLGLLPVQFLNRDLRFMPNFKSGGVFSAYLVGLAFGFGWTPCVGPVLASIFLVISTSTDGGIGVGLLLAYGLGIGVPFVLVALFADMFIRRFGAMTAVMPVAKMVLGGLMVLTGAAMATGYLNTIGFWMLRQFSTFGTVG